MDDAGPPFRVTADAARRRTLDALLATLTADLGVPVDRVEEGAYLLTLPSRLRPVPVWLVVGDYGVLAEAFFLRRPEDNRLAVLELVLTRNARSYGVHFALDAIGDVYLTGQLPSAALLGADAARELDRVLGQILAHVEEAFAGLVQVGFATALGDAAKWAADGNGRRPGGSTVATPERDPRR